MKTVSFIQYKGGTGKTTLCTLLGRLLSGAGYRVLAVDLDCHQYHLSKLLGGMFPLQLCGRKSSTVYASGILSDLIQKTSCNFLDYTTLCSSLCDQNSRDPFHLKKRFDFLNLGFRYDYVFIDTPPGFGPVNELALYASNHIIVQTDMSSVSIYGAERFCIDIGKRSGLGHTHMHVVRHYLNTPVDSPYIKPKIDKSVKQKLSPHTLSANNHVRFITSGNQDFLNQLLPRHIAIQLVSIASGLLHADRNQLELSSTSSIEPEFIESQKSQTAIMFNDMVDAPVMGNFSNDYSVTSS